MTVIAKMNKLNNNNWLIKDNIRQRALINAKTQMSLISNRPLRAPDISLGH